MSNKRLENRKLDHNSDSKCAELTDIFTILETGVKESIRLGENHPIISEYKETFYKKLSDFLNSNSNIPLQVNYSSLSFGNQKIIQNHDDVQSLPTLLYLDSIRLLEFSEGITTSEIDDLFKTLLTRINKQGDQSDIVDLFQKANFEHLTYEVIDYFSVSEVDSTTTEQFEKSEIDTGTLENRDDYNKDETPDFQANVASNDFLDEIKLSENENDKIKHLVLQANESRPQQKLIQLYLDMVSNPLLEQSMPAIIETMQLTFDNCMAVGRFEYLAKYLQNLKGIIENYRNLSSNQKNHLQSILDHSGDKTRIKLLTKQLNSGKNIDLEQVSDYLRELGWNAITNLVSMLGDLNSYPARMMLCNILAEVDHNKIDIIGGSAYDSRWYIVRNIAMILGEFKDSRTILFLKKAVEHEDERVRAEGIKALGKVGGNNAAEILVQMLNDPEKNIRLMAVTELKSLKSYSAYKFVEKIINNKEFNNRSLNEMQQMMEVMIYCGGGDAVDTVDKITKKYLFFSKSKLKTVQEVAINALQFSSSSKAPILLARIISESKPYLKNLAIKVLTQLEFRLKDKADE